MTADRDGPYLAPKVAAAIVAVDFCCYSAFGLLQMLDADAGVLELAVGVLLMAMMLSFHMLFFHQWRNYLLLGVQALLAYVPIIWFGQAWIGMPSFLAGRILLLLPSVAGWLSFAGIVLLTALAQAAVNDSMLDVIYTTVTTALFGLAIYGLTWLSKLVTRLHDAHSELANCAVTDERLRFARDLHDLLGLSLSAISLRGATALRLLARSPSLAKEELSGILDVARRALADVRVVAGGYHELSLEDECEAAESMLSSADMKTTVDLTGEPMPASVRTALARVLREGVTNVLRHSKGTRCEITVRKDGGDAVLKVVNDGATVEQQERINEGSGGIQNLRHRVAELGGDLTAGRLDGEKFELRARIPLLASPEDREAKPEWVAPRGGWRPRQEPPRWLLTAVLCLTCLSAAIHVLYQADTTVDLWVNLGILLSLLALQLGYFSRPTRRLSSASGYLMLGLMAVLASAPVVLCGADWVSLPGLLAGSTLLVLPPRFAWVAFGAVVAATGWGRGYFDAPELSVAFTVIATVTNGLIVYGLTWLSRLVTDLEAARMELARRAVAGERLRFARDLHDLLGLSLSAITLKCELTRRLIAIDPVKARAELMTIQDLTRQALTDVRSVASGYQNVSLDAESQAVRSLLAAADVTVRMETRYGALPAKVRTVLAALLREGVTNALRHSKVRRCEIVIRQDGETVTLQIVNDGAAAGTSGGDDSLGGSGIRNLAHRVRALGGELSARPIPGGRFRLRATLPTQVESAGHSDEAVGVISTAVW
ncbi:sensor histidine kinase [Kibdelosporangium persicum]|uniref:Signal transduction histidine kinase n=1 Tax=Kibdelosporangium persicum TaxID=2698649 RepID=A0ABX2EW57_9PSEU|nr:histidine kinase [Kibdelosporangium persicum]NRN63204.1 hypothetical protein [Kibdelosporangium persicum]